MSSLGKFQKVEAYMHYVKWCKCYIYHMFLWILTVLKVRIDLFRGTLFYRVNIGICIAKEQTAIYEFNFTTHQKSN